LIHPHVFDQTHTHTNREKGAYLMEPESKRTIEREVGGRLGGEGSRGQRDSSLFCPLLGSESE